MGQSQDFRDTWDVYMYTCSSTSSSSCSWSTWANVAPATQGGARLDTDFGVTACIILIPELNCECTATFTRALYPEPIACLVRAGLFTLYEPSTACKLKRAGSAWKRFPCSARTHPVLKKSRDKLMLCKRYSKKMESQQRTELLLFPSFISVERQRQDRKDCVRRGGEQGLGTWRPFRNNNVAKLSFSFASRCFHDAKASYSLSFLDEAARLRLMG